MKKKRTVYDKAKAFANRTCGKHNGMSREWILARASFSAGYAAAVRDSKKAKVRKP